MPPYDLIFRQQIHPTMILALVTTTVEVRNASILKHIARSSYLFISSEIEHIVDGGDLKQSPLVHPHLCFGPAMRLRGGQGSDSEGNCPHLLRIQCCH
jgi:hypothetical protein